MNLFEKIGLIIKTCFSSPLHIEIIIIFILLFLFLFLNLKYKRKNVNWFLTALLCYFLISFLVLFWNDFFLALRSILKKVIEYFYFSPIPVYFLTILISSFCFIKTMFTKKYTKRHKLISYLLLLPIFFLFVLFVVESYQAKISIHELTSVYQNHVALATIELSQGIFFLYLITCIVRYIYHYVNRKL